MTSIKTILNQQYKTIQIEWLRYRNNPYDVQRAHDLRVSIRTLRGLIKFLKRQMPQVVYDSLNGDLSQSAKIFGPLRDLDVLMIQVGKFAYAHPEEKTDYQGLFEGLYRQRNEEMQTTLTDTTQEALATYLMQVKAQLDTLNFKHEMDWDKSIAQEFKRRDHKLMKSTTNLISMITFMFTMSVKGPKHYGIRQLIFRNSFLKKKVGFCGKPRGFKMFVAQLRMPTLLMVSCVSWLIKRRTRIGKNYCCELHVRNGIFIWPIKRRLLRIWIKQSVSQSLNEKRSFKGTRFLLDSKGIC
uniref:CHAD domain-containing protein n=1 Tax=Lentilactobacillus hilgardii TaxID=1588 RepID=UPI00403F544A